MEIRKYWCDRRIELIAISSCELSTRNHGKEPDSMSGLKPAKTRKVTIA